VWNGVGVGVWCAVGVGVFVVVLRVGDFVDWGPGVGPEAAVNCPVAWSPRSPFAVTEYVPACVGV
jgi:hypothetical protein